MHHSPLRVEELVNTIQEKFNPYGKRAYEPGSKHSVSKVVVKAWLQEVSLAKFCGYKNVCVPPYLWL